MSLCMLGQACYQFKAFDRAKAAIEESLAIGRKVGMPAEDMDIARKALASPWPASASMQRARRRHRPHTFPRPPR
jgi:hypothetical protein